MNIERYTERSRGFIQSAQSLAMREGHQQFSTLHLLKVLLDDSERLAGGLIDRAGGNSRAILKATEDALNKVPKVSGGGAGQVYLAPELARAFDAAEKAAEKAGDSFVTVERLLLGLAMDKNSEAGQLLAHGGVTAQNLNAAIESLRKGRTADSATAENAYDALKKYARDLTQAAREGKLDPVIGRDEEIRRTIQVLSRRTKNNPILIGEPGAHGIFWQTRQSVMLRRSCRGKVNVRHQVTPDQAWRPKQPSQGIVASAPMFAPCFELILRRGQEAIKNNRVEGKAMTKKLASTVCALSLVFCGSAATVQGASAQSPSVPPPPLAGPPSPEQVQPWGVPPPPPGIGPVSLFADIHDQPQGKFLEGGAFDKAGNFWFVAIGSGWVSYLTPDAKLVPVFNCNPKDDLGPACEPQGTRWHEGKLYVTTRHLGLLVYDPESKKLSSLVSTFHNELFKGPNDLDFDAEGNLYFTDPWGTGPGPDAADKTGAVYQYSKDGILRRIITTGSFPNGIAISPDDGTLAVADYASNRMLYYSFLQGPNAACADCARDPSHTTFFFATAGSYNPGNGGPDGIHYDTHGNLWAACGIGGVIEYDPRGFIIGYVPLPNGDSSATNFAFGGENNQYIYMEGAVSGTIYKFKAPYPGLIGPDGVRLAAQH